MKKSRFAAIKKGLVAMHVAGINSQINIYISTSGYGMVMNTPEMMEPILPGQGTITPDQEQRHNVIIELNGNVATDQPGAISQLCHNGNTISNDTCKQYRTRTCGNL